MTMVYVCSNRQCGTVWDRDPHGHCPACITPSGAGYSTITREVQPLPGGLHRSKEWWLERARLEPDVPIAAGRLGGEDA